jgi:hypothetical protein
MRAILLADAVTVRLTIREVLSSLGTSGRNRSNLMATAIGLRIRYRHATALYRGHARLVIRMLERMRTMPMGLAGTLLSSQRLATHDPAVQPRVVVCPQLLTYCDPLPAKRDLPFSLVFHVPCRLVCHQPLWDRQSVGVLEPTGSSSAVLTRLAQCPLA